MDLVHLTPEEHATGQENYYDAVQSLHGHNPNLGDGIDRRDFLKRSIAGGTLAAAGVGAMYFNYSKPRQPVRISIIGTGDEGNVLIGALNKDYVEVVSICDIRPSSVHRAFHGDHSSDSALAARPGLMQVYGWKDEAEARKHVDVVEDYKEVLKDPRVQGVIIALPLHLHAPVAVEAMLAGKHVLVEKLMAHNVAQCKIISRVSDKLEKFLSVGHQRHYNILYDNAVNLIKWELLGEIHHIRAQWHRDNLPGKDSWALPIPGGQYIRGTYEKVDEIADELAKFKQSLIAEQRKTEQNRSAVDKLKARIAQWTKLDQDQNVPAERYGYESMMLDENYNRSALEELIRWRLWDRTGGGLMAELGSHQIDAASIFMTALSKETGKRINPMTVHANGGRHIFPNDRDADDHVYCMFEFPGPGYDYSFDVGYKDKINRVPREPYGIPSYNQDPNKKVVVSYSSINGNGFGGYGEIVMGSKATLMLQREKEAMLFHHNGPGARAGVKVDDGNPTLDTSASGDTAVAQAAGSQNVSRGYREEIEHWAWCISEKDWANQPRCNGPVGLCDAVIALTTKLAINNANAPGGHGFIQFKPEWYDAKSDAVPETEHGHPDRSIAEQKKKLGIIDSTLV
jgi:predicted dehydrogenase